MKKLICIIMGFVLVFSLAACGGKKEQPAAQGEADAGNAANESGAAGEADASQSEEPVTLRFSWWGGDARHEATLKAIEAYENEHPNVTIEPEYSSFDGYYEKLVTQLSSENAPDFFQVDQGWVAELYSRGDSFADLSAYSDLIDFTKIQESLMNDYCKINDEVIVLPFGYNGTVFLYNKTLLSDWCDENGVLKINTWNDFMQIGKELHEKDPEAYMTTSVTDGYLRYMLKPMLEQKTGNIDVQDDFTLGFTEDQLADTFTRFMDIFNNKASQPYDESVVYTTMQNNPLWLNGKIGGIFLFFSNIDTEIAGLDYEYGVAPMPMFEEATVSGQESCPSLMVAINKSVDQKQQQAAAQFIDWFLNSEEASKILGTVRGVPGSTTALDALKNNNMLSDLMSQAIDISNATVSLKNGAYEMNSSVKSVYVDYMEKVIYGVTSPEDAASGMYEDLQTVLGSLKGQ